MVTITPKPEQQNAEELFAGETRIAATCEFPSLRQRLATLNRLLAGKNRLIVVTGEAGAGKSTALRIFLAGLDLPKKKCRIHRPLPVTDAPAAPDIPDPPPAQTEPRPIPGFIIEAAQPVLVIDDAHELAAGELAFLLRSCTRKHNRFRKLVLFAEPRINVLLAEIESLVPGNMEVDRIFLPSLGAAETAAYLARLLQAAGVARNPFRPKAIAAIHRASGGIFGRINTEAQERLKQKRQRLLPSLGPNLLGAALLSLLLLLGLAAAVLFRDIKKVVNPGASGIQKAGPLPAPAPMPARQARKIAPPAASLDPAPLPADRVTATTKAASPLPETPPAPMAAALEAPAAPAGAAPTPEATMPQPTPQATPTPKADPAATIRREKWLLSRAPAMYTIQLMAVSDEDTLFATIDQHRLWDQAAFYRSRRDGGDWYPLLYGLYTSKDEARAALAALPPALRSASPWLRRLADIQAAIRSKALHR